MDNDNLRGLTVSGTINSEFTIDGSSNVVSQARVGIQPPADAIQEFKVETAVYDAQIGHTGAGNVNLALKSGTNAVPRRRLVLQPRRLALGEPVRVERARHRRTPRDYNRFSATVGGPIFRNKTFFMGSYEKLQDDTIETVTTSVPTERMRNGDFSELLAAGVQIYNPYPARLVNGVVTRDPFPGNIIPTTCINPIALNVLKFFPAAEPGRRRRPVQQLLRRAAVDLRLRLPDGAHRSRVDAPNRTYGRLIRNFRREERYNFAGQMNGVPITRGAPIGST